MTTESLSLESQIAAKDEGETTSGVIWSGKDDMMNAASAIRFELPDDFVGAGYKESVVLNLYCRTDVMFEDYRIRIGVPATSSQVLPGNLGAITSQSVGSEAKMIGNGTFSPALDHTVGMSYGWVAIDVTEMIVEAIAAGRLSSDYVVFTFVPTASFDAYWTAHGIGNTNPPTLDLEYAEDSPPPPPAELELDETLDDVELTGEAYGPPFFAVLDEPLEDVELEAEVSSTVEASLNETLENVGLTASVATFIHASLDETLEDVSLDSYAGADDYWQASLDETLGDVSLAGEAITGAGGHATFDETLDDVVLTGSVYARSPGVTNNRLFVGDDLFTGDRHFNLFV